MGKIVKYCVSCDEGFAEKFGFCPTCGAQLQSFEMKPVEASSPVEYTPAEETVSAAPPEPAHVEPEIPAPVFIETAPAEEPEQVLEAADMEPAEAEEPFEEITPEPVAAETATASAGAFAGYYQPSPGQTYNEGPAFSDPDRVYYKKDDGYYVTVIQERNVKQRNALLLGATALMLILSIGGTVYSLFSKDLQVGAIDNGDLFAFVPVVEEMPMETEEEKQKKDDEGGGGGGGGRDEKDPTSEGRLANQTRDRIDIRPDVSIVQKDFELKQPVAMTEGDKTYPPSTMPYGVPNGQKYVLSNGQGTGGGQGSGTGTGQGSGRGSGNGSGDGSGSGSGDGDGNGDGTGPGSGRTINPPPPPPIISGVTQNVKILSKPRASYTDAARQNNVQGSVTLRITFLASGQIGGISPVSGLPYGLTEQAIAAARSIRFEPAKRNGVPYTKQMTIQYGFTIY